MLPFRVASSADLPEHGPDEGLKEAPCASTPHARPEPSGDTTDALAAARSFTVAPRRRDAAAAAGGADCPDREIAGRFVTATVVAMARRVPRDIIPNDRRAAFVVAASGEEAHLLDHSDLTDEDVVCLAFQPDAEADGPVAYAIYERRGGRTFAWTKCDPWMEDGFFALRARGGEVAFIYDGRSLVPVWNAPIDEVDARVRRGRSWVRQIEARLREDPLP